MGEKILIVWEDAEIIMNIFSLNTDIARAAKKGLEKTRHLLLKTGRNEILAICVMTESWAELYPAVMWKAEFVSDGCGH